MLFDIVLNNTNMSRELRYNVYETLFGEHITDRQIKDICDGIDNDALSDEFLSYITERFEQSTEEEDIKFHFVCAVVKAKVSVNNGINPLRTAENLLVSGKKDSERLLGLYMISVITWCQYNNINTSFSDCGCTDIHKIIMSLLDCLDSNNLLLVEAASVAMKDMCIAEHFEDSEDYWYTIVNKCCLEISDVRKQKFLRRIISVIPINYGTTGLEFLKQYSSNSKLEITYSWWNEQAQKGEIEGYVVLLWLLDLNFIEEERMNYSRHDLLEYLNGYLEN